MGACVSPSSDLAIDLKLIAPPIPEAGVPDDASCVHPATNNHKIEENHRKEVDRAVWILKPSTSSCGLELFNAGEIPYRVEL
jgi:hypothetical protein